MVTPPDRFRKTTLSDQKTKDFHSRRFVAPTAALGLIAVAAVIAVQSLRPKLSESPPPGVVDPEAKTREYLARIAANPRDVLARLQLGHLHAQNGHYMAALEELRLARSYGADKTQTAAAMAPCLARLARFEEAQAELEPALKQNPDDLHLNVALASVLAARGKQKAGVRLLNEFAARAGYLNSSAVRGEATEIILLMRAFNGLGDSDTAGRLAEEAVALEPGVPDAYLISGRNLLDRGQVERSAERLARASELIPESAEARELHGDALAAQDLRKDAALERWLEAIELRSQRSETYFRAGEALERRKEYDRAAEVYTQAGLNTSDKAAAFTRAAESWERAGDKDQALYCRATAAAIAGKREQALETYRALAQYRNPEWKKRGLDGVAEMYRLLGHPKPFLHAAREAGFTGLGVDDLRLANAYLMSEDAAMRERHLRLAMEKDSNLAATVHAELAASAEAKGDLKRAISRYEKAAESAPGDAASWIALSRLHLKGSEPDSGTRKSIECAARAAAAAPSDAAAFSQLGKAFSLAGNSRQAKQALQHAIDLAPRNPSHYRRLAVELHKLRDKQGAAECERLARRWEDARG